MPDDKGRLFAADIADMIGIAPADWRVRVFRGYAPQPSDRVVVGGHARPVWDPAAVADYLRQRHARLNRTAPTEE